MVGAGVLQLMRMSVFVCGDFFFQAEDGIRDLVRSRGLGDVYKRQLVDGACSSTGQQSRLPGHPGAGFLLPAVCLRR